MICKNGSDFPKECSEHHEKCKDISRCKLNKNIYCDCREQCNRLKCINGQKMFPDGCNGCEPKCKIDCRDRQTCISGKYKVNAQGICFWSFNWY